jgi:transposase-like protein
MTKQRIEVITSVERRRRWSREEKERLVAACLEPGASVSEIARKAGIHEARTSWNADEPIFGKGAGERTGRQASDQAPDAFLGETIVENICESSAGLAV